jgi:hypothetical protein
MGWDPANYIRGGMLTKITISINIFVLAKSQSDLKLKKNSAKRN